MKLETGMPCIHAGSGQRGTILRTMNEGHYATFESLTGKRFTVTPREIEAADWELSELEALLVDNQPEWIGVRPSYRRGE